jgi:hypothetical protein
MESSGGVKVRTSGLIALPESRMRERRGDNQNDAKKKSIYQKKNEPSSSFRSTLAYLRVLQCTGRDARIRLLTNFIFQSADNEIGTNSADHGRNNEAHDENDAQNQSPRRRLMLLVRK